jgi:hypothetical protein
MFRSNVYCINCGGFCVLFFRVELSGAYVGLMLVSKGFDDLRDFS